MTADRPRQYTALGKYYARAAAAGLVALGLAGLVNVLGLSWAWLIDLYHVAVGLLFAYVGFFVHDGETVRRMIGSLGVMLVVVKVPVIFAPWLWGDHAHWGTIEVSCLVVGVSSILASRYLRDAPSVDKEG